VSCGGRRRWWPAPGALIKRGEVWSEGSLGGKPWGGGAHRDEVAAMAAPNRRSGAASGAREGPHELAAHAGRVRVLQLRRREGNGAAADTFE
jgi:hypothetical protein